MDTDRLTPAAAGEPTRPGANTSITVNDEGGRVTVAAHGDLDAAEAPALRDALDAAIGRNPATVRIDMAGVAFLDSVGISVLVSAFNRATDAGVSFELASVPASSRRVLEITRLTDVFTIID